MGLSLRQLQHEHLQLSSITVNHFIKESVKFSKGFALNSQLVTLGLLAYFINFFWFFSLIRFAILLKSSASLFFSIRSIYSQLWSMDVTHFWMPNGDLSLFDNCLIGNLITSFYFHVILWFAWVLKWKLPYCKVS